MIDQICISGFRTYALANRATQTGHKSAALIHGLERQIILIRGLERLTKTRRLFCHHKSQFNISRILERRNVRVTRERALFRHALGTRRTGTRLIFHRFTCKASAAITRIISVVSFTFAIASVSRLLRRFSSIIFTRSAKAFSLFARWEAIRLRAACHERVMTIFKRRRILRRTFDHFTDQQLTQARRTMSFCRHTRTVIDQISTGHF